MDHQMDLFEAGLEATEVAAGRPQPTIGPEPPDDWLSPIQGQRLGGQWRPDPWGAHDDLDEHPYSGEPGKVIVSGKNETRYWRPS